MAYFICFIILILSAGFWFFGTLTYSYGSFLSDNQFIALVGLLIIAVIIKLKYDYDHAIIYTSCFWCGKNIDMFRKTYKWYLKKGIKIYCAGRCERADEASQGVSVTGRWGEPKGSFAGSFQCLEPLARELVTSEG